MNSSVAAVIHLRGGWWKTRLAVYARLFLLLSLFHYPSPMWNGCGVGHDQFDSFVTNFGLPIILKLLYAAIFFFNGYENPVLLAKPISFYRSSPLKDGGNWIFRRMLILPQSCLCLTSYKPHPLSSSGRQATKHVACSPRFPQNRLNRIFQTIISLTVLSFALMHAWLCSGY